MFSFPLIPPQPDAHSLHFNAPFRPFVDYPPTLSGPSQQPHHHNQLQHRQLQQRRDDERKAHNARSPLALLAADEAAIAQRKVAIRNFGAYWIRPPGISKTLQAMTEELAELAEQEELMRQDQGLRDMQALQELEEARERAAEAAAAAQNEEEAGERDLDEDIPEAETSAVEDVTFNEESIMEGSQNVEYALEEAELTGAARDQEDLGLENSQDRDLDDSIPEAGSYQHTDTEDELSSSDSELQDSFNAPDSGHSIPSTGRQTRLNSRIQQVHTPGQITSPVDSQRSAAPGRSRGGFQQRISARAGEGFLRGSPAIPDLSSSIIESSFAESSPMLQRGATARGSGRRRGHGT